MLFDLRLPPFHLYLKDPTASQSINSKTQPLKTKIASMRDDMQKDAPVKSLDV